MIDAALNPAVEVPQPTVTWPLRLAQQAFASVLDCREQVDCLPVASRRQAAQRALSALSIDDRESLEHWLALQLATSTADDTRDALAALGGVDTWVATAARSRLAGTDAELARPNGRREAVPYPSARPSCSKIEHHSAR